MKPIHVHLKPSRSALLINTVVHVGLIGLIWGYFTQQWLWTVLALLSLGHTHYRMTRARSRLTELHISPQGQLSVATAGAEGLSGAELLDGSVFTRWVMVLYVKQGHKKQVLWLLPDSIDASAYRQLLVWGRWHPMDKAE